MMLSLYNWFVLLALVAPLLDTASGHGRLMEPPSRGSMWRQGFPSPINYADNQLFCGGFKHQWEDQDGRCGICGDPYDGPRDHEPGGQYYTGITTRTYTRGQVISVEVELTAFHYGYFEFHLCPLEYRNQTVGQDCFDKLPLKLVTPSDSGLPTRYKLPADSSITLVKVNMSLPSDVTCEQCILQWKYHAANSWGEDRVTGRGCVGCGAQEEFYGCSDITILPAGGATNTIKNDGFHSNVKQVQQSVKTHMELSNTNQVIKEAEPDTSSDEEHQDDLAKTPWTPPNSRLFRRGWVGYDGNRNLFVPLEPKSLDSLKEIKASLVGNCHATGAWTGQAAMDDWCEVNCERGHCPNSHCLCGQVGQQGNRELNNKDYPREPLGPVPDRRGWTPFSGMTPKKHRPTYNSQRAGGSHRWGSPQRQSQHSPHSQHFPHSPNSQHSPHSPSRSRRHMSGAHDDTAPYWGSKTNGRFDSGGSARYYNSNPKLSQGDSSNEDIDKILAYSQETFNSIKDQAEEAYRSVMGKGVPDYPDFYDSSYDPYYSKPPRRKSMYGRSSGNNGRMHRADGYGLRPSNSRSSSPWGPQGRSGISMYKKSGYNPDSPNYFPSSSSSYYNKPSSGRFGNSGRNNDADLISRAQFVDDRPGGAPVQRRLHGKMAAPTRGEVGAGRSNGGGTNCRASGAWTGQASMTKWCQGNCRQGNCPATHCKCT